MRLKLLEHVFSVFIVVCVFAVLAFFVEHTETMSRNDRTKAIEPYLHLDFIDLDNPAQRALLKETLDLFYPESKSRNDSLMLAIESFRQERFTSSAFKTGGEEHGLSTIKVQKLGNMYLQFILIYLVVMILSYKAAQSFAILRFVRMKQRRRSYLAQILEEIVHSKSGQRQFSFYANLAFLICKAFVKGIAYAVLFAPAYVIGYSVKSSFDTSSLLFMIFLGICSNGLLINYANKFYTFLVTESKRGYVQTAIVKNLNASYVWGASDGVPYRAMFLPKSLLPSHVFRHIYMNARFQYLPTLKEFASFLITGLIIIEMALNIQGHLGYELMQNILYKDYVITMAIIVAIFLVVKGTEIVVDSWTYVEMKKYENKST